MSSNGTRERTLKSVRPTGRTVFLGDPSSFGINPPGSEESVDVGKQLTVSESHPRSRSDGSYREGGTFFTSLVRDFKSCPCPTNVYDQNTSRVYSGPICGQKPSKSEQEALSYGNIDRLYGSFNKTAMGKDGTTAIALCSPTNPASDLGTTLAESMREGIPSLPGIQSWKNRTKALRALGSEYLNYQFGWAPLRDEVQNVVGVARHHRDLLKQRQRGEGSDTHRRFDFPSSTTFNTLEVSNPTQWGLPWTWFDGGQGPGTRQVSLVKETKRWFEGCFTYALPSSTDSWRKALGFGSDADQLYGLALNPEILWELTPWSWAVDWFSNTGFVIQNVTSFGLAGLVMRYGYMMEETIEKVTAEGRLPSIIQIHSDGKGYYQTIDKPGHYAVGTESITKRRAPASPFGFGIGWEGLSPTQLAITAALGITKVL